jgi:hypothetical protein
MNGVDANTISTPGTALEVPYDGTISIEVTSEARISGHEARLEFIGSIPWTVSRGVDDGTSWSGSVDVAKYSKYGVGLYRVTGESFGAGACSGSAFVKVTGKSPLSTAAGAAAAGLAGLGALGMIGSAVAAGRSAPSLARKRLFEWKTYPDGSHGGEVSPEWHKTLDARIHSCLVSVPLALLRTTALMVSGVGAPGAPAGVIRWRPYLSLGSIGGSLMAGIGTLILGQQFAVFFPTLTLSIFWLVGWLVIGIAVPSLAHRAGVHKANAMLAQGAAPAWAPTHRVPVEGMQAWTAPDPSSGEPIRLDPGLEVRVDETTGDWARVTAANGWSGWVDVRLLDPAGGAS